MTPRDRRRGAGQRRHHSVNDVDGNRSDVDSTPSGVTGRAERERQRDRARARVAALAGDKVQRPLDLYRVEGGKAHRDTRRGTARTSRDSRATNGGGKADTINVTV